jgi:pyridoxamine 5'-phosphate oxidase
MNGRECPLSPDSLDPDPIRQFGVWYEEARAEGVPMPEACALATSGLDGRPAARMVLLKGFDGHGFSFATNYGSRKGRELAENPHAALLFYWHSQGRQVRVEGAVERLGAGESDAVFLARPRAARISALASRQSHPLEARAVLEERVRRLEAELEGREVERPEFWGGFRVVPVAIEFWQHEDDRLHHRLVYRREGDDWRIQMLQP